jgi:hypothetical protein
MLKRVAAKIRSARQSLNNGTMRNRENLSDLGGIGSEFLIGFFGTQVQRRGAHVKPLKIGSRDGGI